MTDRHVQGLGARELGIVRQQVQALTRHNLPRARSGLPISQTRTPDLVSTRRPRLPSCVKPLQRVSQCQGTSAMDVHVAIPMWSASAHRDKIAPSAGQQIRCTAKWSPPPTVSPCIGTADEDRPVPTAGSPPLVSFPCLRLFTQDGGEASPGNP